MKIHTRATTATVGGLALLTLSSCGAAYYKAMEAFGYAKRDLLIERVEDGRKQQTEAKEQIQETYKAFQELTGGGGSELETVYKKLAKQLGRSKDEAAQVRRSIERIEKVGTDLFAEWETEIQEIHSTDLRAKSTALRRDTLARYQKMVSAMHTAEGRMAPVLQTFQDQVTFLKHNLNAQVISGLETTVGEIGKTVDNLIAEMESSIREANSFIKSMDGKS